MLFEVDINILVQAYKDEIARIQNENILLKARLLQLEQEKEVKVDDLYNVQDHHEE